MKKLFFKHFNIILPLSIILPIILTVIIIGVKATPENNRYKKECLNKNGFVYKPKHAKKICLKNSSVINIGE